MITVQTAQTPEPQFQSLGSMPMPVTFSHKTAFLHGRPRHRRYDDFWIRHPPMDTGHRAKIFAPFAALRGFDDCILHIQETASKYEENSRSDPDPLS